MGLIASQARLLMLTARKSDVEMQGQMINQQRMALSNAMNALLMQQTQLAQGQDQFDPNNGQNQAIQSQLQRLQQLDKILEMQLKRVDTQQQALQTEIEAVNKVIDKNIDMSFKTFA
jgi:hypothetical protein